MKKRTLLVAFAVSFAAWLATTVDARAADGDGAVKVFILAGQSNMQGQGVVSMNHPDYYNGGLGNLVWSMENSVSANEMQHLKDGSGNWVVRDDVTISYKVGGTVRKGGLTIGYTGYGGSSHIGPELQFGHVMGDRLEEPVLLIKTAWGGKSLQVDFRPPSSGGTTGPYYDQMVQEVNDALGTLGGAAYDLEGFIWMQGWNDMISSSATQEYADNLVNLAGDIRQEFGLPGLPFVVGELGNDGPANPGSNMQRFRDAQRAGTERIENAILVETTDFARPANMSPNTGHGHHWYGNAESYFLIGDALGEGMKTFLSTGPLGDLNADGVVDGRDWPLFLAGNQADLSGLSTQQAYRMGDLDGDMDNDGDDFHLFRIAFEDANPAPGAFEAMVAAHAVPEPSSIVLLAVAAVGLGAWRRRRAP